MLGTGTAVHDSNDVEIDESTGTCTQWWVHSLQINTLILNFIPVQKFRLLIECYRSDYEHAGNPSQKKYELIKLVI